MNRRISRAEGYDKRIRAVAKYVMEVTLMHEIFLNFKPSHIAARYPSSSHSPNAKSSMYLARKIVIQGNWTPGHVFYSGYEEAEIYECATIIMTHVSTPQLHESIYQKYLDLNRFLGVSVYVQEYLNRIGFTN